MLPDHLTLTERRWCLLDSLIEGEQTIEQVYRDYATITPGATLQDLQADLIALQTGGWTTLRNAEAESSPANWAAQPSSAGETARSLQPWLDKSAAPTAEAAGASSGIWVQITPQGEAEWSDARYALYWQAAPANPPQPEEVPLRVQFIVAGLCFLLMAIGVWGYAQGTFAASVDTPVNLSGCLAPLRATLAEAGAPEAILRQLDQAARPNIWRSEALIGLDKVNTALDSMTNVSATAAAREKLRYLIAACHPFQPCTCQMNLATAASWQTPTPLFRPTWGP